MTIARVLALLAACLWLGAGPLGAQTTPSTEYPATRDAGPTTAEQAHEKLDDILARQRGESDPRVPRNFDTAQDNAAGLATQLGTRGGASDAEVWEALRFGTADLKVSAGGAPARVVMQDGGMWWQSFRTNVVADYGGYLLLGTIALLALFFLIRGRIRISHGKSGILITRFTFIERFAHWLIAGSFVVLALTGLYSIFARKALLSAPHTANTAEAIIARQNDNWAAWSLHVTKYIHDNVSWAFMLGVVLVFVFWVAHNIPNRLDLVWFAKGGGIIGKSHPPAKKFNAGQKIIFWAVVILGVSISASGLSLLFPFDLPLFAKTFSILNDIGVPGWFGYGPLPVQMAPQEEMQYAQLWHAIIGFVFMAVIIAHIYIGTIGMEGAYDAMGSGEVELNWAKEHHSLWVDEVMENKPERVHDERATPAE